MIQPIITANQAIALILELEVDFTCICRENERK